jgi:glutamate/tyrosine decarboxylase-like PLP-dependent enzyme
MRGAYERTLDAVIDAAGDFFESVDDLPVTPSVEAGEIRSRLRQAYDFSAPRSRETLVAEVSDLLRRWSLLVSHPRYFGLFNPNPHPATVAADALAAVYNPQLAAWHHSPVGREMEDHVLGVLAGAAGFDPATAHFTFTSGGQEANHTAVIAALAHAFPAVTREGLRALPADPVLYVSGDGHHSIEKAASAMGLGHRAVRRVPVDADGRMRSTELAERIADDRRADLAPFMVVATAGTTGEGMVDPLGEIADIAEREALWLHVDAAWAGSALLSKRLRPALAGVERTDSLTWDAHKWLWAPVGTGMFFCRHRDPAERPFALRTGYVPPSPDGTRDPLSTTLQWSRRFIGLRVFMTFAELGMEGVEALIDRQAAMGDALRERLRAVGWRIVNDTPLPVVCFTHPRIEAGEPDASTVADRVCADGRAWISSLRRASGEEVLRACITSYRTDEADLDILMEVLDEVVEG